MTPEDIRKRGLSQPRMRIKKKSAAKLRDINTISGELADDGGVGDRSAPEDGGATMHRDTAIWYERWEKAILAYKAQDPKNNTFDAISRRAGLARSYISNTLGKRTVPKVDDFLAVCNVVGVNPIYILLGVNWTPELARGSRLFAELDPMQQEALLRLLERPAGA